MANPEHLALLEEGVSEWNAWRSAHPSIQPDLSDTRILREWYQGIDLSGADLRDTELRFCLFTDSDFSGANLQRALLRNSHAPHTCFDGASLSRIGPQVNFAGSSFVGTTFEACDLAEVNFFNANLSRARFSRCNLMRAMFRRARMQETELRSCGLHEAFLVDVSLDEARFEDCVFNQTVLAGVDLSQLSCLASSRHDGPSHVAGVLEASSKGLKERPHMRAVIETFLRGAGVQEEYMATFAASVQNPIEFYSCFISYSHSDREFARRLYNDLQMAGIRCWLDEHALLPGDDIYAAVDKGIRLWDKVLLCCSKAALLSWWVERELDTAFEKEKDLRGKHGENVLVIIPLDLDGYLLREWSGQHAAALRKRWAPSFAGWQTDNAIYTRQFARVRSALRADRGARPQAPMSKL